MTFNAGEMGEPAERIRGGAQTDGAEGAVHALARTLSFQEAIFSSLAEGLILLDVEGRIARINPRAREMLGYAHGEFPASLEGLLHRARFLDVSRRVFSVSDFPASLALRGETVRAQVCALELAGGRRSWLLVGAAPLQHADGLLGGAVLTFADITRLREQQEQREDLARMVAHDLRTPLGLILAQAKLMGRHDEFPEELRRRAESIVTSALRMSAMLSDLAETALLETGKLRLALAELDLSALSRELRDRLAAAYGGDRIRIEIGGELPKVWGDANRLERVFMNLLTNALKYSEPGTEIILRIHAEGVGVRVEVEDRGPGIAEDDVPHLFEPYFRAVHSHPLEGVGLGLYSARKLVEAHGGHITVSSAPGKGSTFLMRLPVCPPGCCPSEC